jgi:hypothetical protein
VYSAARIGGRFVVGKVDRRAIFMGGRVRWILAGVFVLFMLPALACGSPIGSGGKKAVANPTATATKASATGSAGAPPVGASDPVPAASAAPAPAAVARIGSRVVAGSVAITLHGVQDNVPEGAIPLKPGTRRYAIEITVENLAQQQTPYSALFGTVTLANDTAITSEVANEPEPPLTGGLLDPGASVRGWLTFDIPTGGAPVQFAYDVLADHAAFSLR